MKKAILILSLVVSFIACNKNAGKSESLKTAYIDTAEILEKYEKFKAEDEKFKIKSEELGRPLEAKVKAFNEISALAIALGEVDYKEWVNENGFRITIRLVTDK